jgi:hypothetical protein
MAWRLRLYEGIWSILLAGTGLRHNDFETRWPNATKLPGHRQQQHNNQTMYERVGAQVARGIVWAPVQTSSFYMLLLLKKGLLGVGCGGFEPYTYYSLEKYLK